MVQCIKGRILNAGDLILNWNGFVAHALLALVLLQPITQLPQTPNRAVSTVARHIVEGSFGSAGLAWHSCWPLESPDLGHGRLMYCSACQSLPRTCSLISNLQTWHCWTETVGACREKRVYRHVSFTACEYIMSFHDLIWAVNEIWSVLSPNLRLSELSALVKNFSTQLCCLTPAGMGMRTQRQD